MTQKKPQHYDESFKRKVVSEYLSTGCSKTELLVKYGIGSKSAVQNWMSKFGYTDYPVLTRKFGALILPTLSKQSKSQNNEELLRRIRELERQLEDEKLRSELYARIIEKAEKELKIPIRKKPNTK